MQAALLCTGLPPHLGANLVRAAVDPKLELYLRLAAPLCLVLNLLPDRPCSTAARVRQDPLCVQCPLSWLQRTRAVHRGQPKCSHTVVR